MTKDAVSAPGYRYDPVVPGAMLFHTLQFWEMPLLFGTAWWNAMTSLYWPQSPMEHLHAHRRAYHEPHGQLVVPDPIEEAGERALVA